MRFIAGTSNAFLIALYVRAQFDDDTYLLFDAYAKHWHRFEEWSHLLTDRIANLKFYNLIALLMSMVVRKRRLARLHTRELLTKSDVRLEEIFKIIGIAQVISGFPARWEAVHIYDVTCELSAEGLLPPNFSEVIELIPKPKS